MQKSKSEYTIILPVSAKNEETPTNFKVSPASIEKMKNEASSRGLSLRQFTAEAINLRLQELNKSK